MSLEDSHTLFGSAVYVCAFGVLLNLIMLRKRGRSAILLACAFFSLGIALFLFSRDVTLAFIIPFGILVVAFLGTDFLLRLRAMGGRN